MQPAGYKRQYTKESRMAGIANLNNLCRKHPRMLPIIGGVPDEYALSVHGFAIR